ncbi:MAG TPA: HEAT repeat domain-containing protein, partial [Gemmataceae bacterium]|nr:HEAT repeat domain-containing protein [Gemmataceae bacterium]
GAFAKQTYEIPGKAPFVTRAAHIFRAKPGGDTAIGVEPVMTGGMDNPVDVVFTPGGERIFTTTFLQYPAGGKRDGLIHAVYGGVYGKEHHDVIDPHIWTGPNVLPPMTHLGAAAPAGLHRYESDAFGKDYKDNLFSCLFNMQKVMRHILVPDGSTFKTINSDFLVSSNKDFHPTDAIEDADGSLLVVDTGGWYKLCCPTTQLIKPDVLGAIYRVRKKDAAKVDDPRGLKVKWKDQTFEQLLTFFDDPRPSVRKRAVETFADLAKKTADQATPEFAEKEAFALYEKIKAAVNKLSPLASLQMVKSFSHLGAAPALADLDFGWLYNGKKDEIVRQALINCVGAERYGGGTVVWSLEAILQEKSPQNRRAAAEALGRSRNSNAVPALLAALSQENDRVLEHSLIYALIEIGDAKATRLGLKSDNVKIRRGALIALDQMGTANLTAGAVSAELGSDDAAMKDAAWWIVGRHSEFRDTDTEFLRERLAAKNLTAAEQTELVRYLAMSGRGRSGEKLLGEQLLAPTSSTMAKRMILKAMAQSGVKPVPYIWIANVANALGGDDFEITEEAIRTARTWRDLKQKPEKLPAALVSVGNNVKAPANIRLSALAAVPGGLSKVEPVQMALLLAFLGADHPVALRSTAADVLSRSKLTRDQQLALIAALKSAGPMELDRVLAVFANATDETVGKELIAALKNSPVKASLRVESLKPRLAKFGPAVQKEAQELYASLGSDPAKQKAQFEKLLETLPKGDKGRGHVVFNSQKAACFSCHAIGYLGGNVGPDLTHIARTRSDRDLLEAVVFPSASFVRGYEPVQVTTKDGKVHNGVLRKDTMDEVVLVMGPQQEVRIAREEIEDMQPSMVSVMPAGFDQVLTPRELADLWAFLKACK